MNYNIKLLPKAYKELSEIWTWYEDKQIGLGDRFEKEFFKKIELIQGSPLQYPVKNKYVKAYIVRFCLIAFPTL